MTQHPSLKSGGKGAKFRSVLKRFEKIMELSEKDKWDEEKDSVYHLPKVKRIKFKAKKVKAAEEEVPAGVEAAAPGEEGGTARQLAVPPPKKEGAAGSKKEGKEGTTPQAKKEDTPKAPKGKK